MATTNKLPTRNELVISALSKTDSKWYQFERKLQLYLLEKFENNRAKILDAFYTGFTKALVKCGTFIGSITVDLILADFKEEDRSELFITQEMLAAFGPASMVNDISFNVINRECDTIKLLLEQSGFTRVQVKGGFGNKGHVRDTYAYIHSISVI